MKSSVSIAGLLLLVSSCADSTVDTSSTEPSATVATTPVVTTSAATTTTGVGATSTQPVVTTSATGPTAAPVPLDQIRLDVEIVADGLAQPIFATTRPGDARLIVVDQPGYIYAVDLDTGERTVVLDIARHVRFFGEQGLLGLAFHPEDPDRMIVHYSDRLGATTIVEYRLDDAGVADPADGRIILTHRQPAPNHNGGMLAFGPDGFLYVGLGDGGGSDDQFDNGQNPFTLLGTILRLDLDGDEPYGIPGDNPFANGSDGAPEVWAYGLRNPWRFSFDGSDLWVGDVGQGMWEEIDLLDAQVSGSNAGWPDVEGTHCFRVDPCHDDRFLVPTVEYGHEQGRCSVTGGVVYRGTMIPELQGTYLYGDYCSGEVWGLRSLLLGDHVLFTDPDDIFLPRLPGLTSFGVGPDGEVYLLQAGLVWRLIPA